MDIANISAGGAVSAALAQQQVYQQQEAGVTMFKKALETQTQGAMMLINSIPQPPSSQGLPSNLGQNINTTA